LPQHGETLAVKLVGHLSRFALKCERTRLEFAFHIFKARAIFRRGAERFAARQQKVAGKSVLHAHDIAHLAEPGDAFQ
jgi:hypothetical protein